MKSEKSLSGIKILLADDVAINRLIATKIISHFGGSIVAVKNGEAAVEGFLNSAPDEFSAILMDINMPVMDGWTATELIRASAHVNASSIPIIAVTSEDTAEDIKRCFACGMNHHLLKPYDPVELLDVLHKHIK